MLLPLDSPAVRRWVDGTPRRWLGVSRIATAREALLGRSPALDRFLEDWDPDKHPRGPGGRFSSVADRIASALKAHHETGGTGDPFEGFSREQLRRTAKARGIELRRGEDRDSIAKKLHEDLGPKPSKKATKKVAKAATKPPQVPAPARELPKLGKAPRQDWGRVISGLPTGDTEEVSRELDVQAALTPRSAKLLNGVGASADMSINAAAHYLSDFREIEFNSHISVGNHGTKEQHDMNAIMGRLQGRDNWWSFVGEDRTDMQGILAHEYGHHVDHMIHGVANRDRLFAELARQIGVKPPATGFGQIAHDPWVQRNRTKIVESVSQYAATNPRELMAEIWAEYSTNPNARPAIKAVGALMRELAEGE